MTLREFTVRQVTIRNMWLLYGDVGYGVINQNYNKAINCGIAECGMVGMAAGMASCGANVACFAIAPHFLRGWDHVRLLVKPEYGVKLLGCGEGEDYKQLGKSHMISEQEMRHLCEAIGMQYCCARNKSMINTALDSKLSTFIQIPNVNL